MAWKCVVIIIVMVVVVVGGDGDTLVVDVNEYGVW